MKYRVVDKMNIQMKENNPELENAVIMLKLCRETNDALWKEIISQQKKDKELLESREGKKLQYEIRRKLKYEP